MAAGIVYLDVDDEITSAAQRIRSATEAKTGKPAEAASAREAASPDTIDSRRLLTSASRESSRKFIRDVAIRDPLGTTKATRVAAEERIRCAADVISSSTSR
jgi:hypothetical protein